MQKVLVVFLFTLFVGQLHAQKKVKIKEHSKIARLLAKIKNEDRYAITFGKTIFVSCSKEEFLAEGWWVRHEIAHVEQYSKHGIVGFFSRYLFHSMFHRYSQIPFEKEAISAENP